MDPLDGAHPKLVAGVPPILAEMGRRGSPMKILEGRRSQDRQYKLWCQGRTAPGDKVTNVDGMKVKSKHQVQADGYHHAVDCVFVDQRGRVSWDGPWREFGELVRAAGLKWGGDFKKRLKDGRLVPNPDSPHVEVPS